MGNVVEGDFKNAETGKERNFANAETEKNVQTDEAVETPVVLTLEFLPSAGSLTIKTAAPAAATCVFMLQSASHVLMHKIAMVPAAPAETA